MRHSQRSFARALSLRDLVKAIKINEVRNLKQRVKQWSHELKNSLRKVQ